MTLIQSVNTQVYSENRPGIATTLSGLTRRGCRDHLVSGWPFCAIGRGFLRFTFEQLVFIQLHLAFSVQKSYDTEGICVRKLG
jgi:hypothetical protein